MQNKLNILHIVAGNFNGGAARGAYQLHAALKNLGVHSQVLSNFSESQDRNITFIKACADQYDQTDLLLTSCYPHKSKVLFSTGLIGIDFTKTESYKNADIIHLHWINNNFIDIQCFENINKPIVWTMRDMWPMTGGCHYTMGCDQFHVGCGNCPILKSGYENDLSKLVLDRKKLYYSIPSSLVFIGISNWLAEQAQQSCLLKNQTVKVIYNGVDTSIFYPTSKESARKYLGINTKKKIITVVAQNIIDFYKGFDLFLEAITHLDEKSYYVCLVGRIDLKISELIHLESKYFGFIENDEVLRQIYVASDVFVAPSRMEAFGKTLIESMACGTPVVCFDSTGPKDIVEHKVSGYKAKEGDAVDLLRGILWVLFEADSLILSRNAHTRAINDFEITNIAKQYIKVYNKLLMLPSHKNTPNKRFFSTEKYDYEKIENSNVKYLKRNILEKIIYLRGLDFNGVIYGHGTYGLAISKLLEKQTIAFIDQQSHKMSLNIQKGLVYSPQNLPNMKYDKILISVLGREDEIEKYLIDEIGVSKEKIIRLA